MKYVKILGLAAVATAALMAFVGASPASATVLCKEPGTGSTTGTTCPPLKAYSAETEIHAVSEGSTTYTTGSEFTEITCKKSTVSGKTENEGSATETVKFKIEKFFLEECSTPNGACTMTTITSGTLEIHWIEGTHNGTITVSGTEITSSCNSIFGNIHCIYAAEGKHLGRLTGGVMSEGKATADIESASVNLLSTSGLCPSEPKWDTKYEITSPKPLYVAGHT